MPVIIPHRRLSPDAVRGVIEAFITREGTDYGLQEVPLATKVGQVQRQLDAGTGFPGENMKFCTAGLPPGSR